MTSESIYAEALKIHDLTERLRYLDRVCEGNPQQRNEVEQLLAAESTTGGVPREPAPKVDATGVFTPSPEVTGDFTRVEKLPARPGRSSDDLGMVIAGRYRLVELLGEGGMGTVYIAEQSEPVTRRVALKLIKSGMDSRTVQARFEAERQALAMMDHPNIARIYDGGVTQTNHPYFVMELVQGVPITEYCDKHRLTVKARLELVVAVCQAVQHAHQKGIIHRDLKPGNILVTEVDGRPTPKIIDFGVAKATELKLNDESFADFGAIVGTPTYMSPEQADPTMDIDTRTDVYALGVILYELLVGSPPIEAKQFKRGAILEMLRMVREVEPPRPSTKLSTADALPSIAANRDIEPGKLAKLLKNELDWIVLKALEKDRTRRYETANGFARDIQRYLSDEVVEARPPSRGYRFKKFVRRHQGQVIAVSLIFVVLLAGITGTTVGLLGEREQRNLAENRLELLTVANVKTETERTRAEQNFGTARSLILDLGMRISQIETGQSNPKLADLARKQALDKAREQFDQFREGLPDDLALKKQASLLHRFAANVSRSLNDYPAAMTAYAASIQITEDLIARFPEIRQYRDELALTLSDRGAVETVMGKLTDATATLNRALKIAEEPQGKLSVSAYRRTIALIVLDLAELANTRGRFEEAAQHGLRARDLLDQVQTAPADERQNNDLLYAAMAVHRLALAQRELGKTAGALAAHEDAVARMKTLDGAKATRDVRFWICETRRERARTAVAVPERRAAALADLAEILPITEKLIEENPQIHFYKGGLASHYLCRGELLLSLNQPDPATAELTKSLAVSRDLIDRHGVLTRSVLIRGKTFLELGKARAAAGKQDEAVAQWKSAGKVFEIGLKVDPDNIHHRRGLAEAERLTKPPAK